MTANGATETLIVEHTEIESDMRNYRNGTYNNYGTRYHNRVYTTHSNRTYGTYRVRRPSRY